MIEDTVNKITGRYETKSSLLESSLAIHINNCCDILLQLISKLVNCSPIEGHVVDSFKLLWLLPLT